MSKLTKIQKAVADLTTDEHHQLTIWLLEHKPTRADKQPDHNDFAADLFQGKLVAGRSGLGKSASLKNILGNKP